MKNPFPIPTNAEQDRCERVQTAIIAELNLAEREGAQPAEVLAALAAAAADAITCIAGPQAVAPWFEKQAETVRELQRGH